MSQSLHNFLAAAYEAATHDLLTDAAASTYLDDFAAILASWSRAMAHAQRGDVEGVAEAIAEAAERAVAADCRKPRAVAHPFVRASQISRR